MADYQAHACLTHIHARNRHCQRQDEAKQPWRDLHRPVPLPGYAAWEVRHPSVPVRRGSRPDAQWSHRGTESGGETSGGVLRNCNRCRVRVNIMKIAFFRGATGGPSRGGFEMNATSPLAMVHTQGPHVQSPAAHHYGVIPLDKVAAPRVLPALLRSPCRSSL